MLKMYYSATSFHLRNKMHKSKLYPNICLKLPSVFKNPHPICCSIYRLICSDTKLQSFSKAQSKNDFPFEPENFYNQTTFLKENFNIVDTRYFKLISVSKESDLENLLKREEFKDVLVRSSFTYNVDLSDSLRVPQSLSLHPATQFSFKDDFDSSLSYMKRTEVPQEHIWCSKTTPSNDTGKPTEGQLLSIIDKLTYTLLNFFEKPHNFSIYHKNIEFNNYIRNVSTKGLSAYIQAMYLLKVYGLLQYARVKVEILKVTHHIEDGTVRVRWRVNGVSRHKLLVHLWKLKKLSVPQYVFDETEWLDGFSIFSVGTDGLIFKHDCDKLTPDDNELLAKKSDIKSKILGLLDLSRRGPASVHAFMSCYKNQVFPNCKRIT